MNRMRAARLNDTGGLLSEEASFLVLHWLNGQNSGAAEILQNEMQQRGAFGYRMDWQGRRLPMTYHEWALKHSSIPQNHLLSLLTELYTTKNPKILQLPPSTPPRSSKSQSSSSQSSVSVSSVSARILTNMGSLSLIEADVRGALTKTKSRVNVKSAFRYIKLRQIGRQAPKARFPVLPSHSRFRRLKTIFGHFQAIYCVAFNTSGSRLFTGSDDNLVKMWASDTGQLLRSFRGHSGEISDISISPDDKLLASADSDKVVRVWNVEDGSHLRAFAEHSSVVNRVRFSPDWIDGFRLLISSSTDGTCRVWNMDNIDDPSIVFIVEALKDVAPSVLPRSTNEAQPRRRAPDIQSVQWDRQAARSRNTLQSSSSDLVGGPQFVCGGSRGILCVMSVNARAATQDLNGHSSDVGCILFDRSGNTLVSGCHEGTVCLWVRPNARAPFKCKHRLQLADFGEAGDRRRQSYTKIYQISFTADDRKIAVSGTGHYVWLFDVGSGKFLHQLSHRLGLDVLVVKGHPTDPRVIISAGKEGAVITWDVTTGHELTRTDFAAAEHGGLTDGSFTRDGALFAVANQHGRVFLFGARSKDRYLLTPSEQFFYNDYAVIREDIHRNIVDEVTQRPPHTLESRLCDSQGGVYLLPPPAWDQPVGEDENVDFAERYCRVSRKRWAILESVRPSSESFPVGPLAGSPGHPAGVPELLNSDDSEYEFAMHPRLVQPGGQVDRPPYGFGPALLSDSDHGRAPGTAEPSSNSDEDSDFQISSSVGQRRRRVRRRPSPQRRRLRRVTESPRPSPSATFVTRSGRVSHPPRRVWWGDRAENEGSEEEEEGREEEGGEEGESSEDAEEPASRSERITRSRTGNGTLISLRSPSDWVNYSRPGPYRSRAESSNNASPEDSSLSDGNSGSDYVDTIVRPTHNLDRTLRTRSRRYTRSGSTPDHTHGSVRRARLHNLNSREPLSLQMDSERRMGSSHTQSTYSAGISPNHPSSTGVSRNLRPRRIQRVVRYDSEDEAERRKFQTVLTRPPNVQVP
eukprot:73585_1